MKLANLPLSMRKRSVDVEQLHSALQNAGYTIPPNEITKQYFGAGTRKAVLDFQTKHGLEATGVVDEQTADLLPTAIGELSARAPAAAASPLVVQGVVREADGDPRANAIVAAFDINVKIEKPLGEARTDAKGNYRIEYTLTGKQAPDLVVRVYDTSRRELAVSKIIYDAKPSVTVDFFLGEGEYKGLSEYEQHLQRVTPFLTATIKLEDLEEKDATYLAAKTGISQQHLGFMAEAARLKTKTNIPAEAFYGLFRQNLPTSLPALLAQDQAVQRSALEAGAQNNIVPLKLRSTIPTVLNNLQTTRVNEAIKKSTVVGVSTLGDLLSTSTRLTANLQQKFATMAMAHKGTAEEFWKKLADEQDFKAPGIMDDLQFTTQLGTLTLNHAPMVQGIRANVVRDPNPKPDALRNLAKLDAAGWLNLINTTIGNRKIGTPADIPGNNEQEKNTNYVQSLSRMIEDSYLTDVVFNKVEKDTLTGKADLLKFFSNNAPRFDLLNDNIDTFLQKGGIAAVQGVSDIPAMTKNLKGLQRTMRFTPRHEKYEAASVLWKDGLDSAQSISRMGKNAFLRQYASKVGGQERALAIHNNARHISATALTLFARFAAPFYSVDAIGGPITSVPEIPNWATLFGSFDLCECTHCRSVYSPAAYLVDILQWLKTDVAVKSPSLYQSGLDVLFRFRKSATEAFDRRADLGEIDLSCENTNTPLPYIDLVNEVFENAIAPSPSFTLASTLENDLENRTLSPALRNAFTSNGVTLSSQAAITVKESRSRWLITTEMCAYRVTKEAGQLRVSRCAPQTRGTAEELRANPEYLNEAAYNKLANEAIYPWDLPFSLWAEEGRGYLEHLGVQRQHLMRAFFRNAPPAELTNVAIAREALGLTAKEAEIISAGIDVRAATTGPITRSGLQTIDGVALVLNDRVLVKNQAAPAENGIYVVNEAAWTRSTETDTPRIMLLTVRQGARNEGAAWWLTSAAGQPLAIVEKTWEFWGLAETGNQVPDPLRPTVMLSLNWFDALRRVSVFLEKSELSYKQLLELLDTKFINRDKSLGIASLDPADLATCNLTKLQITNLTKTALNKIHRFVRLQRQLGWTILELDRALAALNATDIVAALFAKLSHLRRLRTELKTPLANMLSWWGRLDTASYVTESESKVKSLYEQLFLNRAVLNPDDEIFLLNDARSELKTIGALSANVSALVAALGISAEDFSFLKTSELTDDRLNLANLSQLYRVVSFSKALKLSIRDFLSFKALAGINPFNAARTEDTLRFMEKARQLRASGFSIAQLDYLLRHKVDPASGIAPTEESLALILSELRDGLQKIIAEATIAPDPQGELTRKSLALLQWDNALIEEAIATLSGSVGYEATLNTLPPGIFDRAVYETPLNVLPAGIVFPDPIRSRISYDAAAKKFKFTGTMTPAEKTTLLRLSTDAAYRSAVHALFEISNALQNKVSHDSAARKLRFAGALTASERASLLSASTDAAYQTAVNQLYQAPRSFVAAKMKALVIPTFSAALSALPAGLAFPEDLKERIYYDSAAQALRFAGVMTAAEKTALLRLSTEANYQTAINTLFGAFNAFSPETANQFLSAADGNQLFNSSKSAEQRFSYVLARLLAYLRKSSSENLVTQNLAGALQLEAKTMAQLLAQWVTAPTDASKKAIAVFLAPAFAESNANVPLTAAGFAEQFKTLARLHKIALIITKLKITAEELPWMFGLGPSAGWLDLNTLPLAEEASPPAERFAAWEWLVELAQFREKLPLGKPELFEILNPLLAFAGSDPTAIANAKASFLRDLAARTGWSEEELNFLTGPRVFNFAFPDDYRNKNVRALIRLKACFELAKRLGMAATQIQEWAVADLTATHARDIKKAVKAKYETKQWLTVAKPIRDVLREKQRAALVSYLVTHPDSNKGQNWRDSNGLYEHFLIDPEMSACMMTSRIKQAISSAQLFVQRSLMGLEPNVMPDDSDARQWRTWMKNYRVWEANRKVFLYPENWIEPELRDNKSPFFKDLENELLQNEITMDTAETAFLHYLEKLDQVARLEIAGMYEDRELNLFHVFGRTRNTPHIYFYRQWVKESYWTPWEKVDVDIEGDHLIPVVWNRRLYLFWPIFTEKQEEKTVTMREGTGDTSPGGKYWEIQLAWSEFKNGKWAAKKVSEAVVNTKNSLGFMRLYWHKKYFFFKTWISQTPLLKEAVAIAPQSLVIDCHFNDNENPGWAIYKSFSSFWFAACGDNVNAEDHFSVHSLQFPKDPIANEVYLHPPGSNVEFMGFAEMRGFETQFSVPSGTVDRFGHLSTITSEGREIVPASSFPVLNKTPGTFTIAYPHQFNQFVSQSPFFYEDDAKSFFVMPYDVTYELTGPVIGGYPIGGGGINIGPRRPGAVLTFKKYRFKTFYHPYVCEFIKQLNRFGIVGLLDPDPDSVSGNPKLRRQQLNAEPNFFRDRYLPLSIVDTAYPLEEVEFSNDGAYSLYNWELFFHAPFLIAGRLSKNQRFDEALKWFHYVFDPTSGSDGSNDTGPKRFWMVRPFYANYGRTGEPPKPLKELMVLLARDPSRLSPDERKLREDLTNQISEWREHPFQPHLIARLRLIAYQSAVVMKYIDNLIAWGDQLFRRGTIESINEATQLYILAAQILGPRPEVIPPRGEVQIRTYNELAQLRGNSEFFNPLVPIENLVNISGDDARASGAGAPPALPEMLYFCIPKNDKLLGYWDTVADRLFKIRHCMTIEGVVRQLPLFEPPIDPGLLVRAAAAGVDISSALNDLNATLPHYRFQVMLQKAAEFCNDVRNLSAALLSTLEKRDAEALALLRSSQEINLLNEVRQIKEKQIEEAEETLEGLKKSQAVVQIRHDYYTNIPFMNASELSHLNLTKQGLALQSTQAMTEYLGNILSLIPDFKIGSPTTVGATIGGSNLGSAIKSMSAYMGSMVSMLNTTASMSATLGGYQRRFDDWKLQERLAAKELEQIDRQITAAEIRQAIGEKELKNHDLQVENAKEVDAYMRDKFTNQELYDWMVSQISTIYFQSYQMAYDLAKRAEKTFQHELGNYEASFIQFGYWDSLKKGLLAGDKLYHDLKRMEMAYMDQNKREYELTKSISLSMLDPIALINLKETGECFVNLPEEIFDLDYAGHYFRRIKSARLTIPCVTGPHTTVNCTLTLLSNSIRIDPAASGDYKRSEDGDDSRFRDNVGAIQSIATSSGQNDGGAFELNFRDERYLPFEGAGAISSWRIELTKDKDLRQFDYDTITDVIVHVSYMAREGGETLKTGAVSALRARLLEAPDRKPLVRLFSAKHEFPSEWHRFLHPATTSEDQSLTLSLSTERFPFLASDKMIAIKQVELFGKFTQSSDYVAELSSPPPTPHATTPPVVMKSFTLRSEANLGGLHHAGSQNFGESLTGRWTLKAKRADAPNFQHLSAEEVDDIFIVCHYTLTS